MTPSDQAHFLESERLILRPLQESDVEGDYAVWLNDPEVCSGNSHALFPVSREALLSYVRRVGNSPSDVVLAIILRSDGRHIGNVSLQSIHWVNRSAELAILLGAKDCWGQGYGEEAARMMVAYGFSKLGLRRIACGTFEDNTGMQRIAQKLGFSKEGLRRAAVYKDGHCKDVVEYGILAEEFKEEGNTEKP